ncbi:hypothetical protein BG000_010366 [Podila horticola]|nr:hypothetical protein BG000_010366 [Podila horticola]
MNPSHSSYVEYGTGNMLNIDAGTIKRKIDSNEYDDEIIQEVQSVSSLATSPSTFRSLDTDMDMDSAPSVSESPIMTQNTNAMLNSTLASPLASVASHNYSQAPMSNGLLPSALPVQEASTPSTGGEYVPVHGRSMEIPSYARVPMNEMRKYRDQRWSSCIYGADARIGQGMMI